MSTAQRKSANLSMDRDLITEAKALNVNLSRAAEDGVRKAVARAKGDAWLAGNAEAIESYNRYVEEFGLPMAEYRPY